MSDKEHMTFDEKRKAEEVIDQYDLGETQREIALKGVDLRARFAPFKAYYPSHVAASRAQKWDDEARDEIVWDIASIFMRLPPNISLSGGDPDMVTILDNDYICRSLAIAIQGEVDCDKPDEAQVRFQWHKEGDPVTYLPSQTMTARDFVEKVMLPEIASGADMRNIHEVEAPKFEM